MHADERLACGVLVVAGSLTAHAAAYGVASSAPGITGHGATDVVFAVVVPALLGLVALSVVRAAAARGSLVSIGVGRLAAAQAALFVSQELFENLASGESPLALFSHPTLVIGLLLQPLVALVLVTVISRAAELGSSLPSADLTVRPPAKGLLSAPSTPTALIPATLPRRNASRAPPR